MLLPGIVCRDAGVYGHTLSTTTVMRDISTPPAPPFVCTARYCRRLRPAWQSPFGSTAGSLGFHLCPLLWRRRRHRGFHRIAPPLHRNRSRETTRGTGSGRCRRLVVVGGSVRTHPRCVRLEAFMALVSFRYREFNTPWYMLCDMKLRTRMVISTIYYMIRDIPRSLSYITVQQILYMC